MHQLLPGELGRHVRQHRVQIRHQRANTMLAQSEHQLPESHAWPVYSHLQWKQSAVGSGHHHNHHHHSDRLVHKLLLGVLDGQLRQHRVCFQYDSERSVLAQCRPQLSESDSGPEAMRVVQKAGYNECVHCQLSGLL